MRLSLVLFTAVIGGAVGFFRGLGTTARVYPLPHHIPKHPGGISLRFAMVHDVIHERFPRHGRAYYEERNRRALQAIQDEDTRRPASQPPSDDLFAHLDDYGVGLERLGRHKEAIAVMDDKLRRQRKAGLRGRVLYSTKANLGTFLILWQLDEGFADVGAAKTRLTEGLTLVRESMQVNPEAHFGREMWQGVLLEFLVASLDDPSVLVRYDMIGDRLDSELRSMRGSCVHVGAEEGWASAVKTLHDTPVPFDEPTLAIVGMWRYGGGANPHFALALAEIMLRVGQRYIAWCAFERAARLAEHVSSDAGIVRNFLAHCRDRQNSIETKLPAGEREQLRPRFEKELTFGQRYQGAYQRYEAKRIQEGADITDPHCVIATPVGEEDQFVVDHAFWSMNADRATRFSAISWSSVVLWAGLFSFAAAGLVRWLGRWAQTNKSEGSVSTCPPAPPPTAPPPGSVTS
jgi:hypothetical protein